MTTARTLSPIAVWDAPGGNKLGTLPQGMVLTVVEQRGTWLQIPSNRWINAGARWQYAELITVTPPPDPDPITPPPPAGTATPKHVILVDDTGRISVDGLPYA